MKYSKNQTNPILRAAINRQSDIEDWINKRHTYVSRCLNGWQEFTNWEKTKLAK